MIVANEHSRGEKAYALPAIDSYFSATANINNNGERRQVEFFPI